MVALSVVSAMSRAEMSLAAVRGRKMLSSKVEFISPPRMTRPG